MNKKVQIKDQKAITLSPEQMQAIQETKDVGDAMFRVGQQMILALEQILAEDFNFSDKDLSHIENRLKFMMQTLAPLERKGLTILSQNDMRVVSDLAQIAFTKIKAENSGIVLPTKQEVKKLN